MNKFTTPREEARNILSIADSELKRVVAHGDFHEKDFGNFFGLAWEVGSGMRPASIKKKFGVKDHYTVTTSEAFINVAEAVKLIITVIKEGHGTYKDVKAVVLERAEQMRELFPQTAQSA